MRILSVGLSGKMGKALYQESLNDKSLEIVCGVDAFPNDLPIKTYASFDDITEKIDIVIDFSRPSILDSMLEYALKNNTPIVIATTGYTQEQTQKIIDASKKIAIFKTGNFSIAVNLLTYLCKLTKKVLPNAEISITETHHIHKVDAPSGTAVMIDNALDNSAKITSIREGEVVGIHQADFDLPLETLTIKHFAKDRSLFAGGALAASKYLINKPCGLYDMAALLDELLK